MNPLPECRMSRRSRPKYLRRRSPAFAGGVPSLSPAGRCRAPRRRPAVSRRPMGRASRWTVHGDSSPSPRRRRPAACCVGGKSLVRGVRGRSTALSYVFLLSREHLVELVGDGRGSVVADGDEVADDARERIIGVVVGAELVGADDEDVVPYEQPDFDELIGAISVVFGDDGCVYRPADVVAVELLDLLDQLDEGQGVVVVHLDSDFADVAELVDDVFDGLKVFLEILVAHSGSSREMRDVF